MVSYLQQIQSLFRNKVLNAVGVERDFFQLLKDGDVDKAIEMMVLFEVTLIYNPYLIY